MSISREAVIYAYRYLLDRDPESETVIEKWTSLIDKDEKDIINDILESKEFKDKLNLTNTPNPPKTNVMADPLDIIFIGNCQAKTFAEAVNQTTNLRAKSIELLPHIQEEMTASGYFSDELLYCKKIVLQPEYNKITGRMLALKEPTVASKICYIPSVAFAGFHPDMTYLHDSSNKLVESIFGGYHSLLMFYGHQNKLSIDAAVNLFDREIFEILGYFNNFSESKKYFLKMGNEANLPLSRLFDKWKRKGVFMYSINHPKVFVLTDIVAAFLEREGIDYAKPGLDLLQDHLAQGPCWGVYPEIARKLGVEGSFFFKVFHQFGSRIKFLDLENCIREMYATYDKYNQPLSSQAVTTDRFQRLTEFLKSKRASTVQSAALPPGANPYQNLPDYQFWRRGIERVAPHEVDPVVRVRFALGRLDKVATAGSCFAQHISRRLSKNGFNYYVSETGLPSEKEGGGTSSSPNAARKFGVFSARFGNIYTTRQLLQLFDRAYGKFVPEDGAWRRPDSRYVDPFRPQVEPDGYASPEEVERDRIQHLAAVKAMFATLDVFVFTLGLTEAWRNKRDGAVFPLAPGVVASGKDRSHYEFVNFDVNEVVADMQTFIDQLRHVNSNARIILTVSPVPLVATYEDRHVLTSTTYSKSVLRVAADMLIRQNDRCDYFPSYEIITGNFNRGAYYDSNLRSVTENGVDHVMRLFFKHYTDQPSKTSSSAAAAPSRVEEELQRQIEADAQVVCDEEALAVDEFDRDFYLKMYPDVANSGVDPEQHYWQ
jgi:hypothetical protein